jgi:hypothetical protein
MPGIEAADEQLWQVCRKLLSDDEPYGGRKPEGPRDWRPDCLGCRWSQPLLRSGQLDWGACANPQSSRAGLLTFRQQGCQQFEEQLELWTEDTYRDRCNLMDKIENLLEEALFDYADPKTAQANDPVNLGIANRGYNPPPPEYKYCAWYWDNKLDRLFGFLAHLLSREEGFDPSQAAHEVVSTIKQQGGKCWERAASSVARAIECDVSAIRVPTVPAGRMSSGSRLRTPSKKHHAAFRRYARRRVAGKPSNRSILLHVVGPDLRIRAGSLPVR